MSSVPKAELHAHMLCWLYEATLDRDCWCPWCSDFERLIVAMTHYLHQVRKRKEPLEEYLGEIMDFVYRKAGVLQEAGVRDDDGGPM